MAQAVAKEPVAAEPARREYSLRLNKALPYATCFPPENGAHYEQGGFYFDHNGDLVTHPDLLTPEAEDRLLLAERRAKADRAAAKARREALLEDGATEEEVAEAEREGALTPSTYDNGVDLVGWANNAKRYPFFKIKQAFRSQFAVNVNTAEDGRNWLRSNGYLETLAPLDPLEHIGARTIQNSNGA
jgi:hypothetical protein